MRSFLSNKFITEALFTIILTSVLSVFSPDNAASQTVEMFEYTHHDDGDLAVPKFDKTKAEGTEGVAIWNDDNYIHKIFNKVFRKVLTEKKRESLHLNTAVMIAFNRQGEVLNCKFLINRADRSVITEEELYDIYMKFKKIRINPYKVKIAVNPAAGDKLPDYAIISGQMISKTGREKVNKELENQRINERF